MIPHTMIPHTHNIHNTILTRAHDTTHTTQRTQLNAHNTTQDSTHYTNSTHYTKLNAKHAIY